VTATRKNAQLVSRSARSILAREHARFAGERKLLICEGDSTAIVVTSYKGGESFRRFQWKTIRARSIFVFSDHILPQTIMGA
jgi:hypothetical protein